MRPLVTVTDPLPHCCAVSGGIGGIGLIAFENSVPPVNVGVNPLSREGSPATELLKLNQPRKVFASGAVMAPLLLGIWNDPLAAPLLSVVIVAFIARHGCVSG